MHPCQQQRPYPPPARKPCISKACYNALSCKEGGLYVLGKQVVQSNGCPLHRQKTLAFDLSSLDHKKSYELSLVPNTESEATPCSPYEGHFTPNYLIKFFNFDNSSQDNIYIGLPDQSAIPLLMEWFKGANQYFFEIDEGGLLIQIRDKGYLISFTPEVQALRKTWNALRITIKNKSSGSTISLPNNIIDGKSLPSLSTQTTEGGVTTGAPFFIQRCSR